MTAAVGSLTETQFLTFQTNDESFGIGILHIKEIIEYNGVTPIPKIPNIIPGVINLRGNVVPILDLSMLLYKKAVDAGKKTCIIIVEADYLGEKLDIGILVDSVREVVDIPSGMIEPPPSFGSKIKIDYIYGIGKLEEQFLVLLNVSSILSLEELNVLAIEGNIDK